MLNIEDIWLKTCNILQREVTAVSYDLWIRSLAPIDYSNGIMYLSTSSESAKARVLKLHYGQIKEALSEVEPQITDFKVLDPLERDNYFKRLEEQSQEKSPYTNPICSFNQKYTFDNFVVGNSNKYVYAAARGVAEHPFDKINPLFIYGGVGLGKTHLLHAIGNYLKVNNPELKVLYVTCEKFTHDYIESLKSSKAQANAEYRDKYRNNIDVLMIDDIQFISNKAGTQEEFFHTFNDLYQKGKQIIIASDRNPKEIANLEERLRSRFSMGIIQDIQVPDYETRLAILQKKAQDRKSVV